MPPAESIPFEMGIPTSGDARVSQSYVKVLFDSAVLRVAQTFAKALVEPTAVRVAQAYAKLLVLPDADPYAPVPHSLAFPGLPGPLGAPEFALAPEDGEGGLPFGRFQVEPLGGGRYRLRVNIGRDPSGLACEIGGPSCLDAGEGRLILLDLDLRYSGTNVVGAFDLHGCLSELGVAGLSGDGSSRAFGTVGRWNAGTNARDTDLFDCHLYGTPGHNALFSDGREMDVFRCFAWNAGGAGVYGTLLPDRPAALRVRSSQIWGCAGGTLLYDPPGMRGEITGCALDAPEAIAGGALDTYVVTSGNTVRATGLFAPPPAPAWAPYP